ncbi:GSCOCG00009610001-RA-CDS [Cotesia congregata]|nr:GSCOCG00009610001-RA-CDS [Cotesia congregata]
METTNETKAKQLVKNDPEKMEASEKQEPEAAKDEKVKKKSEYEGSVVIWRGVLEWTEPIRKTLNGKPDPEKEPQKSKEIICKLLVWDLDDGINELKRNLPEKLTMTLMRKQFIRNTDKSFFSNSTRTLFDMEASDKLNSLTKFMNSGYFGCIFFSSKPNSQLPQPQLTTKNNKVCTLHYAAERQMYIGFFLNDTTNFLNRMHEIIQYQKGIETFFKPGKITVPNPVVSSFYKDFIVEEYKGELIQQLQSIPRIKEERKERAKMCHENSQSKKVRERKKFLEKQKIRQQKQLELEQEQEAEKKLDEMMKFQNEILEQMPRKIGKKVKIEGTKIEEVQQIFGPKGERLEEAVLQSEMDQLKVLVRQRLNDKQKVVKVLQNVGLKHLEEKVEKSLRKIAVQHQLKVEEHQNSTEQRKEQLRAEQSSVEHLERSLKKEVSAVKQSEFVRELQNNQVLEVEQQSTSKQLDIVEKQCSEEQLEQQSSIEQVEQKSSIEHVEQQSSMEQVEQSSIVLENEQKFVKQVEQQNSTEQKEQQSSTEHKKITAVLLQPQNFITQQKLVEQQSDPELQKFVKQNSMELLELENNCSENLKQSSSDESKSKDKTKKQKTDKVVILQEHKKQMEPERKKEDKKSKKHRNSRNRRTC